MPGLQPSPEQAQKLPGLDRIRPDITLSPEEQLAMEDHHLPDIYIEPVRQQLLNGKTSPNRLIL